MTDHEIDRIASAVAAKMNAAHPCRFSDTEYDGLRMLCRWLTTLQRAGRTGAGIAFGLLVAVACSFVLWALWHGFVAKVRMTP